MGLADLEQFEDLNYVRLNAIRRMAFSGLHLKFLKEPSSASCSETFIWDRLRPIADGRSAAWAAVMQRLRVLTTVCSWNVKLQRPTCNPNFG